MLRSREGVLRVEGAGALPEGEACTYFYEDEAGVAGEVVLCRLDGELYCLDTFCPHEGGRIVGGPLLDGEHVVCPLHFYRFDPRDGEVVDIECPPAKRYRVRQEGEDAVVDLSGPL